MLSLTGINQAAVNHYERPKAITLISIAEEESRPREHWCIRLGWAHAVLRFHCAFGCTDGTTPRQLACKRNSQTHQTRQGVLVGKSCRNAIVPPTKKCMRKSVFDGSQLTFPCCIAWKHGFTLTQHENDVELNQKLFSIRQECVKFVE